MSRTNASAQSHRKNVLNFCVLPYVLQVSSRFLHCIRNGLRFCINAQKRIRVTYHRHRRDWRSSYRPGRPTEGTTIATKPSCLDLRPLGSQFALTKIRQRQNAKSVPQLPLVLRSGRNLTLGSLPSTGVRVRVPPRSWRLYRRGRRGDAPPRGYVEAELGLLDRTQSSPPHAL